MLGSADSAKKKKNIVGGPNLSVLELSKLVVYSTYKFKIMLHENYLLDLSVVYRVERSTPLDTKYKISLSSNNFK